ncbi:ADP-ribosylation factor family domain-containing protein [Ditylenchus destructor]|uniref:ADP-ribosylation factor 1-like 2 n=1 Tax=Ditylenchus destructor TaxID=166010 RepID=A0AAD4N421_9BILA|nr:ADP-ribosylation factor family domain-containing protein [Ditylenchus destructor]
MANILARIWRFLHLWLTIFRGRGIRFVIVGLQGAGKSTLLARWPFRELLATTPTLGFNVETGRVGTQSLKTSFIAFDIGGVLDRFRPFWIEYFRNAQGMIFVVDSADIERIDEAREEIMRLVQENVLRDKPILVLANKQDLQGALNATEISDLLGLHSIQNGICSATVKEVSATSRTRSIGIHSVRDGLRWLYREIFSPFLWDFFTTVNMHRLVYDLE